MKLNVKEVYNISKDNKKILKSRIGKKSGFINNTW